MANLNSSQLQNWNNNGFLKIPRYFTTNEVEEIQRWVAEISSWDPTNDKWMHHYESTPDGPRLSRTENFIPYHDNMRTTVTSGKVLEIVSELMTEPAVLYKEKINYKYPGGGGYAAHQDAPAYEFIDFHITCLISVDSATPDSGCLYFASGRHQEGFIALDEKGCVSPETAVTMSWQPVPTEPGDILLFGSYIPHKSPPNHSNEPRRIIYLTYNAKSQGDWREKYYADKRKAFSQYALDSRKKDKQISKIAHFRGNIIENAEFD